jgi:hypothetical protein
VSASLTEAMRIRRECSVRKVRCCFGLAALVWRCFGLAAPVWRCPRVALLWFSEDVILIVCTILYIDIKQVNKQQFQRSDDTFDDAINLDCHAACSRQRAPDLCSLLPTAIEDTQNVVTIAFVLQHDHSRYL